MRRNPLARNRRVLTAILALASFAAFSERAKADKYCPFYFMGQWNGVYYYYSNNCDTGALGYATSYRLHTLGVLCPSPIDPIIFLRPYEVKPSVLTKLSKGFHPEPKSKMLDFVKPWDSGKKPGQTSDDEDPSGPFVHLTTRFVPKTEEVLKVTDKHKKERFFRVLKIEPDPSSFPDKSFNPAIQEPEPLFIGQELKDDPKDPKNAAQEAEIFVEDSGTDKRHHQLKKKTDASTVYFIISKDKLEK